MAQCSAARQARHRLGAHEGSSETETARRRYPEARPERSYVCPLGGMGAAHSISKKRPGCSQIRSPDFLECKARWLIICFAPIARFVKTRECEGEVAP